MVLIFISAVIERGVTMEYLRIGVIGTGGIGEAHVRRINSIVPGARVTAVNDVSVETAMRVAALYDARFEPDPHRLIHANDVDAVIIASWDPTHEEYVLSCLEAKKYVLCEKPLTPAVTGCKNIMRTEMALGKRMLQVGFMRRYENGYLQLKKSIEENAIGNVLLIHCQHRNKYPAGAKHTTEMTVNGSLVHEFDIMRFITGDEYVSAQWIAPRSSRHADKDLIDPQMVLLETENGIRIDLEMFMNSTYGYDVQCEVVGEDGTLRLPDPPTIISRKNGLCGYEVYPSWSNRFESTYEVELREWVSSVKEGSITGPSAWDGYMTLVVADACTKSRLQKTIELIEPGECPGFYKTNK